MYRSKILPAFFLAMPAAALLTAQAGFTEPAAEQCKSKPGPTTPRGTHWYYRINHADKQHCWYLGNVDGHGNAHAAAPLPTDTAAQPATPRPAGTVAAATASPFASAVTPPATATPALFVAPAPGGDTQPTNFTARWPKQLAQMPDASDAAPPAPSSSYADDEAADDAKQMPPRLSAPDGGQAQESAVAAAALRYFSVAGGLAIPLLLVAGWAAKYARRARPPQVLDQAPEIEQSRWRPRTLTDPADDLKKSLAELMQDLRRAAAAAEVQSHTRPVPRTRQRTNLRARVA